VGHDGHFGGAIQMHRSETGVKKRTKKDGEQLDRAGMTYIHDSILGQDIIEIPLLLKKKGCYHNV
jgi:hypothetical protein